METYPFGQLGNLKELIIRGMQSVKTLGTEFYGSSSSPLIQPFISLETLRFEDMQEWEEWELIGGTSTKFPSLTRLSLYKCPKLRGSIPDNLPSHTCLSVKCCPELEGMSLDNLPSLSELELEECPLLMEPIHSDDNSNIIITSTSSFVFNTLRKITLGNIPSLTLFPRYGLPKTLQSLCISDCENLVFLPYESFCNNKSLENLGIFSSCNSMTSFTLCSLPVLKTLYIFSCKNLKSIVIAEDVLQQNFLFLKTINIYFCEELESISFNGLPIPNLIDLSVHKCKKLCSLPEPIKTLASLQRMVMLDLPNLQSFSIGDLPISLWELWIGEILWNTTWEHHTCLSVLGIKGDDNVKALMKMDAPRLPASLVSLYIYDVVDITCWDGKWLQHLISLQKLVIDVAPRLTSLLEEGLPSSLQELHITDCLLLKAILRKKRGKEWRKISHIPLIYINNENITFT